MHAVLSLPMEFLPKIVLQKLNNNYVIDKLVISQFPDLCGYCFKLYCACDQPQSLQCISRIVVIKQLLKNIVVRTDNWVPWTNCCSLLSYVCLNPAGIRIITFWHFLYCKVNRLLKSYLKCYDLYRWQNKIICVFDVSDSICMRLLAECHSRINMPEGKGYHLLPTDQVWKSTATATLNSGRTCSLRFVKIRGVEFQERAIKRKLSHGSRALFKLMQV